jgi:predicted dehydrogenase
MYDANGSIWRENPHENFYKRRSFAMRLRVGFAGLGAMGLSHINSIKKLCGEQMEIAAVCARSETNLEKVKAVAPEAKVFQDERELIHSDLEVVFISTPNFTHVPLALETLKAGKDLFLEKPCGITRGECDALLAATKESKRIVMIGHELRYSPYFQKIKELVSGGEIGTPRMVWCREFRGPFQKKSQNWIQDNRRSGGTLVDKNCHHFDLMNWWAGAKPIRVAAFGGCAVNRVMEGPEQGLDHATVSFEYDSGVRGTLQLCMFARDFPSEDLEFGVVGDAGMLQTRISEIQILHWQRGAEKKEPRIHQVIAKHGEGWGNHLGSDEMHLEFLKCVLERQTPLTSVPACLDGTRLAISAEESIRRGEVVSLI